MNLVTAITVEGALKQANEDAEFKQHIEQTKKEEMIPRIKEMFQSLDADGSGEVTLEEFANAPLALQTSLMAFTGAWAWNPVELFLLIDEDNNETLELDEFVDALHRCARDGGFQKFQMERMVRSLDKINQRLDDEEVAVGLRSASQDF